MLSVVLQHCGWNNLQDFNVVVRYSCEHMTQVHLFHNHGGVLSGNTVKGEGYW